MQTYGPDGSPQEFSLTTLGLSPTFFGITTVNTTGGEILAANRARKLGVFLQSNTTTNVGLYGDTIDTAVVPLSPGAGTSPAIPVFIPGGGAIYVKAAVGPVQVVGYWI